VVKLKNGIVEIVWREGADKVVGLVSYKVVRALRRHKLQTPFTRINTAAGQFVASVIGRFVLIFLDNEITARRQMLETI